jgi:SAM-dependent methyltransferase
MIDVNNLNRAFPKYPITIEDKGWVYGVWYCGTSWHPAKIYGQYPPTFLKRALALFPKVKFILHCPSGTVTGPGICVDIKNNNVVKPKIIADSSCLPFQNNSFDLWLADPPYSYKDSRKYGTPPFSLPKMMKEAQRILKPGGYLGVLHVYYPSYSRKVFKLVALICVVTGFLRKTRIFSIFQKR